MSSHKHSSTGIPARRYLACENSILAANGWCKYSHEPHSTMSKGRQSCYSTYILVSTNACCPFALLPLHVHCSTQVLNCKCETTYPPHAESNMSAECRPTGLLCACRFAFFLAQDTFDHTGTLLKSGLYMVMYYSFAQPRAVIWQMYLCTVAIVYACTGTAYLMSQVTPAPCF